MPLAKKNYCRAEGKRGTRSGYDDDRHPKMVRAFLFDHPRATLEDLAEHLGIDTKTLRRWDRLHDGMNQALREGRGPALARLLCAGLDAACGFHYSEEVVVKGEGVRRIERYAPPNPAIWCMVANNFLGWVRGNKLELSGPGGGPIQLKVDYSQVSDEAARALLERLDDIAAEAEAEAKVETSL